MAEQEMKERIPRTRTGKIMREKMANHPNPGMRVTNATEKTAKA